MFHVNAWGLPYVACWSAPSWCSRAGLDGSRCTNCSTSEKVTLSAGVPTVWLGLLDYVEANKLKIRTMKRTVIGGSACPTAMIRTFTEQYGVQVMHAWGMTEMSPLGTVASFKAKHLGMTQESATRSWPSRATRSSAGHEDHRCRGQGPALGRQQQRRHGGARSVDRGAVLQGRGGDPLVDDWFPTGDVALIDEDGYMQITDRSKDVIKSGGEWISSIDIENIAMGHPAVAMAACIAAFHPKWDERPLLIVVRSPAPK